jgi:hypothetical protein
MAKETIRVYYSVPTTSGYEKTEIKLFSSMESANKYASKLVKELKQSAKETDDDEGVMIENIASGTIMRAWKNEEGKIVYYAGGW